MTALTAGILGIGVWGPGLEGWAASRPILAGDAPYEERAMPPPAPAVLPPTERRRAGAVVRLALTLAGEASDSSGLPPAALRSVFASGNGDGVVVGSILEALIAGDPAERPVSPTQFHNSVHNAAAGYWSIAQGSVQPASCLGLHDDTWPAALLKSFAEVTVERVPLLLVAYDHPLPPPLHERRPTCAPFGLGLVLAPVESPARFGQLRLRFDPRVAAAPPKPRLAALGPLAGGNAIARALPLLEAIACAEPDTHRLPYGAGSLALEYLP